MLIGGRQELMVMDPVPARGHPDHHQDHTQEGKMTTLLPQMGKKSVRNNHQANMISVRSRELILLIIEMTVVMLIIATMKYKTTLHRQRLRTSGRQNHQESQTNMIRIQSGDPMPLMIEMTAVMLILVPKTMCMLTESR